MFSKLLLLCVGLAWCDDDAVMTTDMTPDEGPETGSAYVPGTAGGEWSDEEVASTRRRILKMITPIWKEKMIIGTATSKLGKNTDDSPGEVTENVIMRLVFHDCIPYLDGTGGCDGCLNWHGMYSESPSPNKAEHFYAFDPVNATDNKGLDGVAIALERIYRTIDWPYQTPSLEVSLYQSGKSRADLWQLAGMVALEQSLERANRACDLDYHARQQVMYQIKWSFTLSLLSFVIKSDSHYTSFILTIVIPFYKNN